MSVADSEFGDIVDGALRIEDLVEREALGELCRSFFVLFGIGVRIFSSGGALIAEAATAQSICAFVAKTPNGRVACSETVGAVKALVPDAVDVLHPCFTGAQYRVCPLVYEGRSVGRLVIGPYLPVAVREAPPSLLALVPPAEAELANVALLQMPKAKVDTVARIATHLKNALDLILFSGHRALLSSRMHLASAREGYRALEEKNVALQETYEQLKELDRLKSNFLATVSHELRTPLTSIIGYSEMLGEGLVGPLTDEQTDYVRTIRSKGEQLLGLILSLLDLTKLDMGSMHLQRRRVAIKSVLEEAISSVKPQSLKRSVTLLLQAQGSLSDTHGDPERLRQVFINLIDNAIKFTPQGGTVSIAVTEVDVRPSVPEETPGFALLAASKRAIEVRVADTGIGIPQRERSRVFDAFYQVDSSSTREFGGAGLGLSIVKRLVDAHEGGIRIEDNAPSGTVFVVELPALGAPS